MKKRMTALLLAVVLFSASVIGNYDRAQASGIVIGGTVGVAEFILSLLASAGITYITVDTLTQGWGANSKKAYEEIASQLEQAYEGRRLEVIEGGGGGSEQPPKWDKFMDAAITAKAVEYTPGIWDCVKHAINQVMKTRYDVEKNEATEGCYTAGTLYRVNPQGELQYPIAVIKRGYLMDTGYSSLYYPDLNKSYSTYYQSFLEGERVICSFMGTFWAYRIVDDAESLGRTVKFSIRDSSRFILHLYDAGVLSYSSAAEYDICSYFVVVSDSSSYVGLKKTINKDVYNDMGESVPAVEYIFAPYIKILFGDGMYFVPEGVDPDPIVPGSSDTWKNPGNLDTMPQPAPVNFPTADQIQALIDALNQANNNNPENEDEKREEQATVVDDFVNDLVKPDPGTDPEPDTKPDPGTDPEPDTKPDPGTDPEPDTKPDPGTDPEPDTKPDPGTDPKPDTKPDTELEPSELEVDLTTIFPFCIPFDLMKLLAVLDAEPETPVFDLKLPYLNADGQIVDNIYTIDFSSFDELMQIVRMGELLVFLIGLAIITSKVIKW